MIIISNLSIYEIVFNSYFGFLMNNISAQELFVVTDPASNVPAGSLYVRIGQSFLKNNLKQVIITI